MLDKCPDYLEKNSHSLSIMGSKEASLLGKIFFFKKTTQNIFIREILKNLFID